MLSSLMRACCLKKSREVHLSTSDSRGSVGRVR
jgi:hypothetical protein